MKIRLADPELATGPAFKTTPTASLRALALIAEERRKTATEYSMDDSQWNGELAKAAAAYAVPTDHKGIVFRRNLWPWDQEQFKPSDDRIRELVKAGGLIVSEIERLQRSKDAAYRNGFVTKHTAK